MKANPGGTLSPDAIIGRETEINEIWKKLEVQSVVLTAERRVGKTCVMRKMNEITQNGWTPLLCFIEKCSHPVEFVERFYEVAISMGVVSKKKARLRSVYKAIAGTEIAGWKIPSIMSNWKKLLVNLVQDVANNTDKKVLVMLDEFPLAISKIANNKEEAGPNVAMDLLDTLRALRQEYESSSQIRFIFSGSIGLHLILEDLRRNHEYKSNPTSDMFTYPLGGMNEPDVEIMCQKYLDEEKIRRNQPSKFAKCLYEFTDGLPLYIQYICSHFQDEGQNEVSPSDIEPVVRELMDNRTIEGFGYAAERIENYYNKLHSDQIATLILKKLSHKKEKEYVDEKEIIDEVRSQIKVEDDDRVLTVLELLLNDNYLVRDTSTGKRRYRFRYNIMRWWWEINKG